MAENKKAVLVYADWIDKFEECTDEEAGKLIKHFFRYVNDLNPEAPDRITKLLFTDIKNTLKRDLAKYEVKIDKKSISGREGNLKRWHLDLYNDYKKGTYTLVGAENIAKGRKVSQPDEVRSHKVANIAVNDSVSVNDSVNDKVSVKVKDIKEVIPKIQKEFSAPVLSCYNNCLLFFPEEIRPKLAKGVFNWRDTIEKLNRIDKIPFEVIEEITKKTRLDPFWSKNFLSLTKLRQTQKNSELKYIQVFNENIKNNGQSTRTMQEVATDAFNSEVGRNFRFK